MSIVKMDHSGIKTLSPARHAQKPSFGMAKTVFAPIQPTLFKEFARHVLHLPLYIQMVNVMLALQILIMMPRPNNV